MQNCICGLYLVRVVSVQGEVRDGCLVPTCARLEVLFPGSLGLEASLGMGMSLETAWECGVHPSVGAMPGERRGVTGEAVGALRICVNGQLYQAEGKTDGAVFKNLQMGRSNVVAGTGA